MADTSMAREGNPFQQARPLGGDRITLFTRSAETLAERYQVELSRWVSDVTVSSEPISQVMLPSLIGENVDVAIVKARYHVSHGAVVTDLPVALALVAMLCGGPADAPEELRPLSRLEMGVFDLVVNPLVDLATEMFEVGPAEISTHVSTVSGLPDSAPEPAVAVPLTVTVGEIEGTMTLGLTVGQLQHYNEDLDRRLAGRGGGRRRGPSPLTARAVRPVEVDLIVGFDLLKIPAGKLADLKVGDVLRTQQSVAKNLVARVGEERIFTVRAAQRGQRLVAELIAPADRDRG